MGLLAGLDSWLSILSNQARQRARQRIDAVLDQRSQLHVCVVDGVVEAQPKALAASVAELCPCALRAMAFNAEHVQRSKPRIETRLKLLAKWSKKYADRMTHSGDADNAIKLSRSLGRPKLT